MKTTLGVNIDHVATLRQARGGNEPDPVQAAIIAELAGAHGITVHLRQDRRHIQERDLQLLREVVKTRLNVEMAAVPEMIAIACRIRPETVTLVPEHPGEITTTGGLDLCRNVDTMREAMRTLQSAGIEVSLFVDPHTAPICQAIDMGCGMIELNTARYSETVNADLTHASMAGREAFAEVVSAAELASRQKMRVLAGHGLTYRNVFLIAAIPEIEELNIGHNIMARAVLVGLDRAIREMHAAMGGEILP